ncbi:MAG: hypothetical protein ACWGSQ_18225, partial [Longimicrobiales bacterium]
MHPETRAICMVVALCLSPVGLSAQLMPGGRTVDVAGLRGDFYNQMVAKVNEVMDSWQSTWRKVGKEPL